MISLRFLTKRIVACVARILSVIPCRYIVFESLPDYADNTRAVFDEMVRRNLNKKYKFVWLCKKSTTTVPVEGVKCAYGQFYHIFYSIRAKILISCNSFLTSYGNYQKSLYLCHGVPLKSLGGYKAPEGIDYIIGLSEDTNQIQSKELGIELNKFRTLGYPRNDALSHKSHNYTSRLFCDRFEKYIVWYPTFRQHGSSKIASATSHALPIIYNTDVAKKINEFAEKNKVLIILKPHFSQDTSYIQKLNLSNIVLINDQFFIDNNISSYEFVGGCDALITDYSSIYFDYLLLDKPVAAIWEDIDEYRRNRGFAIDVDYYMSGAYKIYDSSDFLAFLKEIVTGIDSMKDSRHNIINLIHYNKDFDSTKRVVDFVENVLL